MFRTYLFTYDRPKMLKERLQELNDKGIRPIVLNDGVTFPHRGKRNFWKTWHEVLQDAEKNEADIYLFMPDDFENLDVERIKDLHEEYKAKPYVYNLINDGREKCWTGIEPKKWTDNTELIGFTDGAFFCNRQAFERIGFYMKDPKEKHFKRGENISSGIGMMLTLRLNYRKVLVFRPYKSLAYHGNHESKMHPEERKNNPLISKH